MELEQHTPLNESILNAQDERQELKITEDTLEKLAKPLQENNIFTATEKEILECAADLVQRKRGVR